MRAQKKGGFDEKLARLRGLGGAPEAVAAAELGKLLADENAFFVGEAAKMAKELELRQLGPDLVQACKRLLAREIADRGCIAKRHVLDALVTFEVYEPALYLEGLRYEQIEMTVGPAEDTAGSVRGLSAHGLVRIYAPDAIQEVAPLLFDDLPEVRAAAAQALASTGDRVCAALLHLRVLAGERKPEALEALYRSMLALDAKRSMAVVAQGLAKGEEAAALALGESRLPEAFPVLKEALSYSTGNLETTVLLSMALLRAEAATAYLQELVESGSEPRAIKAIQALGMHRHDERLTERMVAIVKARKSKKLAAVFAETFGRKA